MTKKIIDDNGVVSLGSISNESGAKKFSFFSKSKEKNMNELYKPYSEIYLFDSLLTVTWYKVWENIYEIDNSTLIFGYDKSKYQEGQNAGVLIDEYFDWYDFSLLRGHIGREYDYDLLFDKIVLPIEPKESSSLISKLKCASQNTNIVRLFTDEVYEELAFEIHGYCDVREIW